MSAWKICYECDGERYFEIIEDPAYGNALTSRQIAEIAQGLRGESDDVIRLLWWRPLDGEDAPLEREW